MKAWKETKECALSFSLAQCLQIQNTKSYCRLKDSNKPRLQRIVWRIPVPISKSCKMSSYMIMLRKLIQLSKSLHEKTAHGEILSKYVLIKRKIERY